MNIIDLHMHSLYSSDGEFTPEVLLEKCRDAGVRYMAIADHNSVKGARIAVAKQSEYGLTCIPAIEIDATCESVDYHILGYGIDVNHPVFDKIEKNVEDQEVAASKTRCELIKKLGIQYDEARLEELSFHGIVTGEAIAEAAMEYDKDHSCELLQPYYEGGSRSDNPYVNFYWDYCSAGKPAFVEVKYPSVKEIVELLHQQNALVVMAHPGQNAKEMKERLEAVTALGIDGMEVYSSYHTAEQTAFYEAWAKDHGLLMTCGSDYHGKTKPSISIGQCNMPSEYQEKLVRVLEKL